MWAGSSVAKPRAVDAVLGGAGTSLCTLEKQRQSPHRQMLPQALRTHPFSPEPGQGRSLLQCGVVLLQVQVS